MNNITITTFTDPMMGLTYEMEPIYDKLKKEYPNIQFKWIMSVLVKDVSQFMLPGENISQYNKRLAKIYESEQSVGNLPIKMPNLHLFDEEHRTSLPLNLAYKAAQLTDSKKADQFLKNLRHATIIDVLPTTHDEEILKVVEKTKINKKEFLKHYTDGSAQEELNKDLTLTNELNIHLLPSMIISSNNKATLLQGITNYYVIDEIIKKLCNNN